MSYVAPAASLGAGAAYLQPEPSPMKNRRPPNTSVLSHQPVSDAVCTAAIVRLSGRTEGRTTTSKENAAAGVHAVLAGTSTYWLVPSSVTDPSEVPAISPGAPCVGEPTYEPDRAPVASAAT